MRAKSFLQVSLGILALALAYHLGATSATAQAPSNPVVGAFGASSTVVTANGDVYHSPQGGMFGPFMFVTNVFGSPTPAQRTTFGELKARYRGEREPAAPSPATGR